MKDDSSDSLETIKAQNGASISSALLRLQEFREEPKKSIEYIKSLRGLYVRRRGEFVRILGENFRILRRESVDVCQNRNYVAVSYTWNPSEHEDRTIPVGRYLVQSGTARTKTKVRNSVLDRAISYLQHTGSDYFWIDQECIDQDRAKEKNAAMQVMDLVYSFSKNPVALLSMPIKTEEDMDTFITFMRQDFVTDSLQSTPGVSRRAEKVWELLQRITSDPWWNRAWTFQEDHCSASRMTLLIPHSRSLEDQKQKALNYKGEPLFGTLVGELCVGSADFRAITTEFCQMCESEKWIPRIGPSDFEKVLSRAGKYTILLQEPGSDGAIRKSMSPHIIADIGSRGIKHPSDRLAIAANCCRYPVYLNFEKLNIKPYSFSLAMMALYLLNGEIIMNDNSNGKAALKENIFSFLKNQSLSNFCPPVVRQLTFISSCRFIDVSFTKDGIKTCGHLWKLGGNIRSDIYTGSGGCWQWRLSKLADELRKGMHGGCYKTLANDIQGLLEDDEKGTRSTFSQYYKVSMAEDLVAAWDSGLELRLASIESKHYSPYRGIFFAGGGRRCTGDYVFTSSCPPSGLRVGNHVSLAVEWKGTTRSEDLPRLFVKHWVNGLCFFNNCYRREVVFPWPPSLT